MALYSNGNSVSGSTVKLTDTITMVMQLDAEFIGMKYFHFKKLGIFLVEFYFAPTL